MPNKRRRRWDALVEDDPLVGLINLFDLWMVFSIALLLSLATCLKLPQAIAGSAAATAGMPSGPRCGKSSTGRRNSRTTASAARRSTATAFVWVRRTASNLGTSFTFPMALSEEKSVTGLLQISRRAKRAVPLPRRERARVRASPLSYTQCASKTTADSALTLTLSRRERGPRPYILQKSIDNQRPLRCFHRCVESLAGETAHAFTNPASGSDTSRGAHWRRSRGGSATPTVTWA